LVCFAGTSGWGDMTKFNSSVHRRNQRRCWSHVRASFCEYSTWVFCLYYTWL